DVQFFYGKGAGGHPTGSAVLSDIAALRYWYRYEYKKHIDANKLRYSTDWNIKVYLRYEDESLVDQLGFTDRSERFYSPGFKYVIGTVNLGSIITHKNHIDRPGVFIAELG